MEYVNSQARSVAIDGNFDFTLRSTAASDEVTRTLRSAIGLDVVISQADVVFHRRICVEMLL